MKRWEFCWAILLVLVVTACGSQAKPALDTETYTPAPSDSLVTDTPPGESTPTATHQPSSSPAASKIPPTSTRSPRVSPVPPTPTATILPVHTPIEPRMGPERYDLKEDTEQETRNALLEAENMIVNYDWNLTEFPYKIYDLKDYQLTLEIEALLQYPKDTDEWTLLSWGISRMEIEPGRRNVPSLRGRFENLLQDALNRDQTTPETLGAWLEDHGYSLEALMPADNLTGDRTPGWALQIGLRSEWDMNAIFVLNHSMKGDYQISLIYPWTSIWHGFLKVDIVDSNDNGRPEILVMDHFYGVGFATWEDSHIYLFEWHESAQSFANLAQNIPMLQTDEMIHVITSLDPPNWKVGALGENGTPAIIATVEFLTPAECPLPTYQIIYAWVGGQYQWADEGFIDYDLTAPLTCQVLWALQTGRSDSTTIGILKAALEDKSQAFSTIWGPAAKDYLRYQLGILYALSDQREQAVQQLQKVRDEPDNPEYLMTSQLARIFLRSYVSDETISACMKSISYINNALQNEATYSDVFGNIISDSLKPVWGVHDPRWIWDGSAVCNIPTALKQSLNVANPQNTTQLVKWLNGSGIGWGPLAKADIDGNAIEDWLVTIRTESNGYWEAWEFLRDGEDISPVFLSTLHMDNLLIEFKVVKPDPGGNPVGILYDGTDLEVFVIRQSDPDLLNTSRQQASTNLLKGQWGVYPVDDYEVSSDGRTISLFNHTYTVFYSPRSVKQATYQWNDDVNSYILVEGLPSPQGQMILTAEQALFETNRPDEAIIPLQKLLLGDIIGPVTTWHEGSYVIEPPSIQPYILYLLGLAYELSGDEDNAVNIYWEIWHDYPHSPYAIIASRKLNPTP